METTTVTTQTDCPVCSHDLVIEATSRVRHADQPTGCPCPCEGSWADPHRHPTGDHYEATPDGLVRVEELATGRTGLFLPDGTWHSGELKFADPHMVYFATSLGPRAGEEH